MRSAKKIQKSVVELNGIRGLVMIARGPDADGDAFGKYELLPEGNRYVWSGPGCYESPESLEMVTADWLRAIKVRSRKGVLTLEGSMLRNAAVVPAWLWNELIASEEVSELLTDWNEWVDLPEDQIAKMREWYEGEVPETRQDGPFVTEKAFVVTKIIEQSLKRRARTLEHLAQQRSVNESDYSKVIDSLVSRAAEASQELGDPMNLVACCS